MKAKQVIQFIKSMEGSQVREFLYGLTARPKTFPKFKKKSDALKSLQDKSVMIEVPPDWCDHIELSGLYASAILTYGTDKEGMLRIHRHVTFPAVRLSPDETTSSFCHNFLRTPQLFVDGVEVTETLKKVSLNGRLELNTDFKGGLSLSRTYYPSKDYPALIEKVTVTNCTDGKVSIEVLAPATAYRTPKKLCIGGVYVLETASVAEHGDFRSGASSEIKKLLVPSASYTYCNVYSCRKEGEELSFSALKEIKKRERFLHENNNVFTLKTQYPELNALYSLARTRGLESIFATAAGLLHSPGGGNYYAAVWANDQMEYAAPVFPLLGSAEGIDATKNALALYEKYADCSKRPFREKAPLPSSIISEGRKAFGVAGDRGDTAMAGLGIAQFLLNLGDAEYAREHLFFVEWCVDFCLSRKTEEGVIASDSDELEGRFPSGRCNLATNINTCELLKYAEILEQELGNEARAVQYHGERHLLHRAIRGYFERVVEGYQTYQYFEGNKHLRSWICLPLTAGFLDRKEGTVKALTEVLYEKGRLRTASNKKTVWDRSLLYAVKGMFLAEEQTVALNILREYSAERLLGAHSPYPFEAYPEGNGAHLSGESLLYLRTVLEGFLGLETVGFQKFILRPMPLDFRLTRLCIGGKFIDIEKKDGVLRITLGEKTVECEGNTVIDLNSL